MRIIKEGNLKQTFFVGECARCGTEVEAEPREVQHPNTSDVREASVTTVKCPHCNATIYVQARKETMKR